jgi:hypothetical protein
MRQQPGIFKSLSAAQMRDLEARTAPIARQALFFRNWHDSSTAV